MSRIAIFVVWVGPLPNGFSFWLDTARRQPFDLIFITDQPRPEGAGDVTWVPTTLAALREGLSRLIGYPVSLEYPYKLSEYRPFWGLLYQDLIEGYDYWGHTDLDMVFGDMTPFLEEALQGQPDKVFNRGHFGLFRNIPRVNEVCFPEAVERLRFVFQTQESCGFDEWLGIGRVAQKAGLKMYLEEIVADIRPNDYRFRCTAGAGNSYEHEVFLLENGELVRYYVTGGAVQAKRYAYIHFQKRRMSFPEHYDPGKTYQVGIGGIREIRAFGGTPAEVRRLDGRDYIHAFRRLVKRARIRLGLAPRSLNLYLSTLEYT
ncbi:DUF6625 family protein [Dinghuibacter silviterrae]|uniref:Uncharacterized protein n=1 Tax=Dinghuibacter silviterrae TaxID=1539049 RepID=A0A4R8DTW2_9BACT|nr:DUF6625 family protein [Dinghuibacter silviterrae]TDX01770.1 hypothetical protein EDB95_2813 [Dinghuibacter silviterrae]